ncbi:MAG: tRNA-dihydrouridine synthase [bacterium]
MNNFWLKLKKPIFALAPLAGVSDSPFRQMCKQFGAAVVYSEMASVTALVYNPVKTLGLLLATRSESPYVIQLFGSEPKHFAQAVELLTDVKKVQALGLTHYRLPQGFDINLGCPVPKVRKQTAGCALFSDLQLARQVIISTINSTDLPVSVKIRSRVGEIDCLQFLDYMSDLAIKAVMIHGRSLAQGFSGPVDYELIKQARDHFHGIILANGGVHNSEQAKLLLEQTQADGLGLARGTFGRPWLFEEVRKGRTIVKTPEQIKRLMWQQAKLAQRYGQQSGTNFLEIRKHLGWYASGWSQAKSLRLALLQVQNLDDIRRVLKNN